MEGFIRQLLTLPQVQELTAGINGREKHSVVTGLSPVQRAAVAAAAAEQTGRPLLMLCADEQECTGRPPICGPLPVRSRWCCRLGNGSCGLRRRTAASGSTGGCGLCTGWRRKRPA